MKRVSLVTAVIFASTGIGLGAMAACGSSDSPPGITGGQGNGDGGATGDGATPPNLFGDGGIINPFDAGAGPPCVGLQCQIHTCAGKTTGTQITGKVYDPAGNNPLYNVVVYVPNAAVQALPAAPANECGSCNSLYSGDPIAAAVTDATGTFTMNNAPDGADIPIVIQIGKWRKQTSISAVTLCGPNAQPDKSLKLPSKAGPKDDLPQIAISTGGADSLECLLRRVGVDKAEYTEGPGGTGHIHIFQGSSVDGQLPNAARMTANTPAALTGLWDKGADLSPFDILILSCEGQETTGSAGGGAGSLTPTELAGLQSFTGAGGRAFLSHFHYKWLNTGPFSQANPALATWTPNANPIEDKNTSAQSILGDIVTTLPDGGVFQKGQAFNTWLGPTVTNSLQGGELPIFQAKHNSDVKPVNTPSQEWIKADSNAVTEDNQGNPTNTSVAGATEYFTFDTPLGGAGVDDAGAPIYCGRVVYSDLHVGGASGDYLGQQTAGAQPVVPDGCANNPLSPQEKALEFMLFDLSSCVTPDTGPGAGPPPIIQPPPK